MSRNKDFLSVSGIYRITNTLNGHTYIGSAENIRRRWNKHRSDLRKGIHHSGHLQNAFNKYGEEYFEFSVILFCDNNELIYNEQMWMDKLNPEYNMRPIAESSLGIKRSAETRAKIGKWHKGKTISKEQKEKMSSMVRGYNNPRASMYDDGVIQIRKLWDTGSSVRDIAIHFCIPMGTVRNIVSNSTWKHLPLCTRKGSNRGSQLTELDVLEMRRLYGLGLKSSLIGKMFKLTQQQAWKVVNYWSWKSVA